MTEQSQPTGSGEPAPLTSPNEPPPLTAPAEPAPIGAAAPPPPAPSFEERMERFGKDAEAAGQRLGREAQAAGERLSKDPGLVGAADLASRVFGLFLLAAGVWFFLDVTLAYDLPALAWGEIWPLALILIGLVVVLRGVARRT